MKGLTRRKIQAHEKQARQRTTRMSRITQISLGAIAQRLLRWYSNLVIDTALDGRALLDAFENLDLVANLRRQRLDALQRYFTTTTTERMRHTQQETRAQMRNPTAPPSRSVSCSLPSRATSASDDRPRRGDRSSSAPPDVVFFARPPISVDVGVDAPFVDLSVVDDGGPCDCARLIQLSKQCSSDRRSPRSTSSLFSRAMVCLFFGRATKTPFSMLFLLLSHFVPGQIAVLAILQVF